jgi:hypothetical protein
MGSNPISSDKFDEREQEKEEDFWRQIPTTTDTANAKGTQH